LFLVAASPEIPGSPNWASRAPLTPPWTAGLCRGIRLSPACMAGACRSWSRWT